MHVFSTLVPAVGLFAHLAVGAYKLQDDYGTSDEFFDNFDFFTVGSVRMVSNEYMLNPAIGRGPNGGLCELCGPVNREPKWPD